MDRDRNLLFGVLAVQLKLVSPNDLMKAAGAWAADSNENIGGILVRMGFLTEEKRNLVTSLVEGAVKANDGDASKSLQALGGARAVHETFAGSIIIEKDGSVSLASFGGAAKPAGDAQKQIEDTESLTVEHPGRYTIKGEQGRGGIGRVLIAFDEHVGREIALKELLPEISQKGTPPATPESPASPMRRTGAAVARFLREARVTGQLEHPGIVPVYEIGKRPDESLYYTMKLVRGKTLADKLREAKTLPDRLKLLPHFLELCQTIAYAHSKGVIHRDIKPQNVMVGEFGETVVLDWGLAKVKGMKDERAREIEKDIELLKASKDGETVEGKPIGTPAYMPPEQADGRIEDIDERSDVWSLGAVLYEILTEKPPFDGANAYEIIGKVISLTPKPVIEISKDAPAELAAVAERCLSHDIEKRYPNADSLAEDIKNFQSGGLVSAYEYIGWSFIKKWAEQHWPLLSTLSITFLAVLLFGIVVFSAFTNYNRNIISQVLLLKGELSEKDAAWNDAKVYFSASLVRLPSDEAKDRLSRSMIQPINMQLIHTIGEFKINLNKFLNNFNYIILKKRLTENQFASIAFSPDSKFLFLTGGTLHENNMKGIISIWETSSGKLIKVLEEKEIKGYLTSIISPDGNMIAALNTGEADKINVWDISKGNILRSFIGHVGGTHSFSFSPNSKLIASGSKNHTVDVLDIVSGKLLHSLEGSNLDNYSVEFSPDGKKIVFGTCSEFKKDDRRSYCSKYSVKIFDSFSGNLLKSIDDTHGRYSIFSSDGNILACGGGAIDVNFGKLIIPFESRDKPLISLAFSPDNRIFASASNVMIQLWDISTGILFRSLKVSSNIFSARFSTDSQIVAFGSGDDTIRFLHVASGDLIYSLKNNHVRSREYAFSQDGKYFAALSFDGTAKIWAFNPRIKDIGYMKSLDQIEKETGLKIKGTDIFPWDPKTGKVSEIAIGSSSLSTADIEYYFLLLITQSYLGTFVAALVMFVIYSIISQTIFSFHLKRISKKRKLIKIYKLSNRRSAIIRCLKVGLIFTLFSILINALMSIYFIDAAILIFVINYIVISLGIFNILLIPFPNIILFEDRLVENSIMGGTSHILKNIKYIDFWEISKKWKLIRAIYYPEANLIIRSPSRISLFSLEKPDIFLSDVKKQTETLRMRSVS